MYKGLRIYPRPPKTGLGLFTLESPVPSTVLSIDPFSKNICLDKFIQRQCRVIDIKAYILDFFFFTPWLCSYLFMIFHCVEF